MQTISCPVRAFQRALAARMRLSKTYFAGRFVTVAVACSVAASGPGSGI
jgi:hypothetical protein